jgi:hypothetical protein
VEALLVACGRQVAIGGDAKLGPALHDPGNVAVAGRLVLDGDVVAVWLERGGDDLANRPPGLADGAAREGQFLQLSYSYCFRELTPGSI